MTIAIATLANTLLRKAKIKSPPVPIEKIAAQKKVKISYAVLDGDVSGLLYRKDKDVVIGVNASHVPTRQRFTIAHELGHFLLDHDAELYVDKGHKIIFRDSNSKTGLNESERQANQFAAVILMPEDMIRDELNKSPIDFDDPKALEKLAGRFGVSTQALTYRLINLNLVDFFPRT